MAKKLAVKKAAPKKVAAPKKAAPRKKVAKASVHNTEEMELKFPTNIFGPHVLENLQKLKSANEAKQPFIKK